MRARQGTMLEALRRTKDFLDDNGQMFDTVNKSPARRELEEIAARLAKHGVTQDRSHRAVVGETARQRTLRTALRSKHMQPIAAVAKQRLQGVPEFEALRMPRSNLTVETLIVAARGMAAAARVHAAVLIENGLPDDFIDQLLSAASALEGSIDQRNSMRRTRVGSTAGLATEESRGRKILRVLDAVVRSTLGGNETLLAEWRSAKRVKRARSTVTTTAPTSIAQAAASAQPSPAELRSTPPTTAEAA